MKTLPLLLFVVSSAAAQTTTVTGLITDPAGDPVSGSCVIQSAAAFTAIGGSHVTGAPMTVRFSNGAFRATLIPTDSATPAGQFYAVTCSVPAQTVNNRAVGPFSWGPRYWLVPTDSGAPFDVGAIEVASPPPSPSLAIVWPQLGPLNGMQPGQIPVWNGLGWRAGPASGINGAPGTWPAFATVATSGSYTDLANTPTLGTAAAQNVSAFDAAGTASTLAAAAQSAATAASAPAAGSASISTLGIITAGTWHGSVIGTAYLPTIPAAQVNGDWNASTGLAQILNKPTLGTAAAQNTGAFDATGAAAAAQLASAPAAGSASIVTLGTITTGTWHGAAVGLTYLPTIPASQTSGFATVATSGAYANLTGLPTLGTAAAQNTSAFDAAGVASAAQMAAIAAIPAASSTLPVVNGTAAAGTGTSWARADHAHPTDTTRAGTGQANIFTVAQTMPSIISPASSSATDSASLGPELTGSTGWTSTAWTGSYNAFTHTTGNTSALSYSVAGMASGQYYQVVLTITARTVGSVSMSIGSTLVDALTGEFTTGTFTRGPMTTGTGAFTLTPTSNFDGTVAVSIKAIASIPTWSYSAKDSMGAVSFSALYQGLASLRNLYEGGGGSYNTTGSYNSAQGVYALQSNTTGSSNSAQGVSALGSNTTGYYNVAQGANALASNTTGYGNAAQGYQAIYYNTTGSNNSAQGLSALLSNTAGNSNSAQGMSALYKNTTGNYNSAQGQTALYSNATGGSNSAIGFQAGYTATGGNANVSGSNNTWIGSNSGPGSPTQYTYQTAIGSGALGACSYCVVLGRAADVMQSVATTFSTLPACAAATEGTQKPITDSTTNTWGATITGGSNLHVLAYCDGTNWTTVASSANKPATIYQAFQGGVSPITQAGSDTVIWTFSGVPALAAGQCYAFSSVVGPNPTAAMTIKIFVDGTQISTPVSAMSSGYLYQWQSYYCNNPGVQNAQTLSSMNGLYVTTASWSAGHNWTNYIGENPQGVPTAIDWSVSHTITVKSNSPSGTVAAAWFKIN